MTNNEPLVSVAIVTYNQKNYLIECIKSILAQDYTNFEIVVADDGSKDGTREVLLEFKQKYPDKFVLRLAETNQGITANHNAAHFACQGKYVSWIGGDDLMMPSKIKKQVEFMESHSECAVCYHQLNILDSISGKIIGQFNRTGNIHEGGVDKLIKYGSFNGACSCMVRASFAPKNGFNNSIPVASDWLYYIECLSSGGEIRYINETLGLYRRHIGNATDEANPRFLQNVLDHLATCSLIITKYPGFSKIAFRQYIRILRNNRKLLKLDYDLLIHFFDLKSIFAYIIYKLSFNKLKL
jgi:glycosyltransferase involved in cell wall biosynthesis